MKKKQGYLLILTLLVMAALLFFAIFYLSFYNGEQDLALRGQQQILAEGAAAAAVDAAIYELKQDNAWISGFSQITLPHSNARYSLTFNKDQTALPYSTNNLQSAAPATGYQGRIVPPHCAYLVGIGFMGFMKQTEQAMITLGNSPFINAATTMHDLNFTGSVVVDSYNSDNGTYAATRQNSGGNIGTNSGANDMIELHGSAQIYGNLFAGPGGSESGSVDSSGSISYLGFGINQPISMPFLTPPSGTSLGDFSVSGSNVVHISPGIYDELNVTGSSVVIFDPGIYVFTDEIKVSGSAILRLPAGSDPVTIYAMNEIHFSGSNSINNQTQLPKNFVIIGGPNTEEIDLGGSGIAYMSIYAPAAEVSATGSTVIYGAIASKSLDMHGSSVLHYDAALKNLGLGGGAGLQIKGRW